MAWGDPYSSGGLQSEHENHMFKLKWGQMSFLQKVWFATCSLIASVVVVFLSSLVVWAAAYIAFTILFG